jgi:hypothetical protein
MTMSSVVPLAMARARQALLLSLGEMLAGQ